jgi:DNA-binding XRE family transcriptional regulator
LDDVSKTAGGFAEKFKACRKRMNLTQQKIGELAGLSQNQISKYEKGIDIPSVNCKCKLNTDIIKKHYQ